MRNLKKKSRSRPQIPRARNTHSRQRQKLIDACISALHIYGPSRTTVEKVVAIADMSPGIVRFYFASKASMLVASLQFLAAEFEEKLLVPVGRLKPKPVAALQLMVDLYLDSEIASPRKVSVWYAFWGEASSRQEYYDICGKIDERFAALVHELIERLIIDTSQPQLDPKGIALGLMGALEMLWQDFAFRSEGDIDRAAAKQRCMAYLQSIFPGQFPASALPGASRRQAGANRVAVWAYENNRLFALERRLLFQDSWQFVGHRAQLPSTGDFLAPDLGFERPLILRDSAGDLRAFRNSCTEAPHMLTPGPSGCLSVIRCTVHGLEFDLDGTRRGGREGSDLTALELCRIEDLILVRSTQPPHAPRRDDSWPALALPNGSRPLQDPAETFVSADWKLIVEQCLEFAAAAGREASAGWSRRSYDRLLGSTADFSRDLTFVEPNHLVEIRPDGFSILQVLPIAPGRSCLRSHHYTHCSEDRPAVAAQYLASRLRPLMSRSMIAVAESTQKGLTIFGDRAVQQGASSAAEVAAFRQYLLTRMPALGFDRPPSDS